MAAFVVACSGILGIDVGLLSARRLVGGVKKTRVDQNHLDGAGLYMSLFDCGGFLAPAVHGFASGTLRPLLRTPGDSRPPQGKRFSCVLPDVYVYLSTQGKQVPHFSYLPTSTAYAQKPSLSRFYSAGAIQLNHQRFGGQIRRRRQWVDSPSSSR